MFDHPVPEELLKHIGDIIVSFAYLESFSQSFIGSLINEHQRIGQIITAELSFKQLRALLIGLYKERHGEDDDFQILKKLMERAEKIEGTRNNITHSIWGTGNDPNNVTRLKKTVKGKHGIRVQSEKFTADTLKAVATEIKCIGGELVKLKLELLEKGKVVNNPTRKQWP